MPACSTCRADNPPHARFCLACGSRLEAVAQSEERKVVTVLFADVVGFTSLAERLDPEDVRAFLTPFYSLIRSVLSRYGGSIEHFLGDGVMAVFGAPVAHEDDPERAVRAALAIRDAVREQNEHDPSFQLDIRVGVNTGEVLISHEANGRLVAGDAVNTAQRLQTAAAVNGILVGEATYGSTARHIEYSPVGAIEANGKSERVLAWEAVAPLSRFGPEVARDTTGPLVGRDAEIALLEGLLRRAVDGAEAQLATIVGGAGRGKSRLVTEIFVRGVRDSAGQISWRQGRCPPYGERAAYSALGDMVRAQAGILDTDGAEVAGAKLHDAILRLGGETDWLERHVRPLVGLASDGAGERVSEAHAAWRQFFRALADERPLVMVVEDVQWADDGLLDWIDSFADSVRELPVLVVCTARPELLERRPRWGGGKRNATMISLAPLTPEDTRRLVRRLLEGAPASDDEVAAVVSRSEGNPLYAEEFARMLRDCESGGSRSTLPMSIQGIVAARIDALAPEEKALLLDAAVVGKSFWPGMLAAIGGGAEPARSVLRSLERRELIRRVEPSSVAGEDEYTFRNRVVREVAYGLLPRTRRAEKHLLAAAWIEQLAQGREDHAAACAEHYRAAIGYTADPSAFAARARVALREAGDRALALATPGRAAELYREALELWPPSDPARARLLLDLGRALHRHDQAGDEHIAEARDLLLAAGDLEGAAEADVALALSHFGRGRRDEATQCLERAADLLRPASASRAKVLVLSTLASFRLLSDRVAAAIATGRQALEMAEALDDDELRARCLRIVGAARASAGDDAGVEQLERAVALARRIDSVEAVPALTNLAAHHVAVGDLRVAFPLQHDAAELARRFGDTLGLHWLAAESAFEAYWCGRWDDAVATIDQLLAQERGLAIDGMLRVVRARIALFRGDDERALDESERALRAARVIGDSQFLFPALALRARVLASTAAGDASPLADELLRATALDEGEAGVHWPDLAAALLALGRADELAAAAARAAARTRWAAAAAALGECDRVAAAALYAEIGSLPDEADALLLAGEPDADRAIAFFASVAPGEPAAAVA